MTILEVRELTVDFRQRGGGSFRAVDHCSFWIKKGETLALVGESGSGKSTVVRAVGRLLRPSGGEVLLDGRPAGRRGRALRGYRRRVQLIFQDPFASLNPMHTVRYHLARPTLMLHPGHSRARLDADVHELLRSVNLTPEDEIAGSRPHELSGGQRQRVAIARALASGPEVLLADEPVSMLDVSIRLEILNLLDRLKRERNLALLYVTHDLATARHFSSRIMVMYRGQIVEHGPADEVILRPAHPYTRLLAAAAPDPGASRESLPAASGSRPAPPRPAPPRPAPPRPAPPRPAPPRRSGARSSSTRAAGSGCAARTRWRSAPPRRRTRPSPAGMPPAAGCTCSPR
jgi:peptide/nickel transport system ATP-binding protein